MSGRLVLLRHGQSYANVERRLDTRPPGAELTSLGREQARSFAAASVRRPALLAHSAAIRTSQTAEEIGAVWSMSAQLLEGIYEVQAGDLENRTDDDAIAQFNGVYRRWLTGDLDVAFPSGESAEQVLQRYLPVVAELRRRYLDDEACNGDLVVVSHGAAIRLVAATLAGVDGTFALDHPLDNTQAVVLVPTGDSRWSCTQWGAHTPPFGHQPQDAAGATALRADADPMG